MLLMHRQTRMGFGRFVAATLIDVGPKALMATYLGGQAPQYAWVLLSVTGLTMGALTVAALLSRRKQHDPHAAHLDPNMVATHNSHLDAKGDPKC